MSFTMLSTTSPEWAPVKVFGIEAKNQYVCHIDELRKHLDQFKDEHVAVITAMGPSRKGKSFLLNYMARYLTSQCGTNQWPGDPELPLKGFSWRAGKEPETMGIWISEPFVVERSDGSKLVVLLLDTQGLFDRYSNHKDWLTIVGISLMVSSLNVFNLFTDIQEDRLIFLESFLDAGLQASAKLTNGQTEKPFQNIMFVVRDWDNQSNGFDYGRKGGQSYLDYILEIVDSQSDQARSARTLLRQSFQRLDCFLMPPIGNGIRREDFNGSFGQLDTDFFRKMQDLVVDALYPDDLEPKRLNGRPITCKDLMDMFDGLVKVFNSDDLKHNMSSMLTILSAKITDQMSVRLFKTQYLARFRAIVNERPYLSDKDLNQIQNQLYEDFVETLNKEIHSEDKESIKSEFEHYIHDCFKTIYPENKTKRKEFIEKVISESRAQFSVDVQEQFADNHKQDVFKTEDKLRSIENHTMESLYAKVNKDDLDNLFIRDYVKITEFISKTKDEIRIRAWQHLKQMKMTMNNLLDQSMANYNQQMNCLLDKYNEFNQDEFDAIESKVRQSVVDRFAEEAQDISEVEQLRQTLVAKQDQFKLDYQAKWQQLMTLIGRLTSSSVATYTGNMNQMTQCYITMAQFDTYHDYELRRIDEEFERSCKLTDEQRAHHLNELHNKIQECHDHFKTTVEAKNSQYETALASSCQVYEKGKQEFIETDWVFEAVDMEALRRELKSKAASSFDTMIVDRQHPYGQYLYQLKNDIDENFDKLITKVNKTRATLLQVYDQSSHEIVTEFRNNHEQSIEQGDDQGVDNDIDLQQYVDQLMSKIHKLSSNKMNEPIEDRIRSMFLETLLKTVDEVRDEYKKRKTTSGKMVDEAFSMAITKYEKELEKLTWLSIAQSEDQFKEKENMVRQEVLCGFTMKTLNDCTTAVDKDKLEAELNRLFNGFLTRMVDACRDKQQLIRVNLDLCLAEYNDLMKKAVTASRTKDQVLDFDRDLQQLIFKSFAYRLRSLPDFVVDTNQKLLDMRLNETLLEMTTKFDELFRKSHQDVEREMSQLQVKYSEAFSDITEDNYYTDDAFGLKNQTITHRLIAELYQFIEDRPNDEPKQYLHDFYKNELDTILQDYEITYREINEENRIASHDKMWSMIGDLLKIYSGIVERNLIDITTEVQWRELHESALERVMHDYQEYYSEFHRQHHEECVKQIDDSVRSAHFEFRDKIRNQLLAKYHGLIAEQINQYSCLISKHVQGKTSLANLDNHHLMLKEKLLAELRSKITDQFGINVQDLCGQLEQSMKHKYEQVRKDEEFRINKVIEDLLNNMKDFIGDYQQEFDREIINICSVAELRGRHTTIKNRVITDFKERYQSSLDQSDLTKYVKMLEDSLNNYQDQTVLPAWQKKHKKRQHVLQHLKSTVATHYQDEINKYSANRLYIKDSELRQIHDKLCETIVNRFQQDFEALPRTEDTSRLDSGYLREVSATEQRLPAQVDIRDRH